MSATLKKLPKGLIELSFVLTVDELKTDLENAARNLTEQRPMEGFRPGKAPYDVVKSRLGEMPIYEHALPAIVRKNYVRAVEENKLRVYGEPSVNITAIAPGNDLTFVTTVAVVPEVTKLADHSKIKVTPKAITVPAADVDQAIKDLTRMQTKEAVVERAATDKDKVVIDMNILHQGVPVEGGQAKGHGVYLDEDYFIPGFKDQMIGLKAGDEKKFQLKFPSEHYQKMLAGKDVDFEVTVRAVEELRHPDVDEAFAKSLGQESVEKLRAIIEENIRKEAEDKEEQRIEIEILEKLVEGSEFEEVPEKILNDEISRMMDELKHGVAERKIAFEDYLASIKKTVEDLKLEFVNQAIKRIKTALVIREVGEKAGMEIPDTEVLAEVQKHLNQHAGNAEMQAQIRTEEYENYVRTNLRNRKVLATLREQATK